MLSVNNISSAQAETYYSKDDYYLDEKSEWHGKGAEDLNLIGEIKKEDWLLAVNGFDPNMNKLNHNAGNSNKKNYRAGTDLTFSAPKSVSIAALNDKNIISAHEAAVSNVLNYIENNYSKTRVQKNGVSADENAKNLLIGKHLHLTSRELEPQLHTHSVVINSVLSEDGKRRSLKNDEILKNTKLLGLLYRNELAQNLQNIGYDINITDRKEGYFQLDSIDESLLDRFSTRRKQVLSELEFVKEKYGNMSEREASQKAALNSRVSKKSISREELVETTNSIMKTEFDVDLSSLVKPNTSESRIQKNSNIDISMDRTVEDLHDSKSVFGKEELYKNFALQNFGEHTISSLESTLKEKKSDNSLIQYNEKGKSYYSSKKMKDIEHYSLKYIKDGIGKSDVVVDLGKVENKINEFEKKNGFALSEGQKNMATVVSTSKDRFIKIQGDAGTGKTTSLSIITKQFEEEGKNVVLLGPTARAAAELEASTKIKAQTVASFLLSKEAIPEGSLIVIDESGMLGAKDAKKLIDLTEESNSKLIFMGDTKQFQSISAGNFLKEIDKTGASTVVLDDSRRQKTPELQTIVDHIVHKDIDLAFNVLSETNKMVVNMDRSVLLNTAVDQYTKNHALGINTLLITSKNEDREELNDLIRQDLKSKDLLENGAKFEALKSKSLSATQKKLADNYELDNVLIAHKKTNNGISKGEKYRITEIDINRNTLKVESVDKKSFLEVDLKTQSDAFQTYTSKQIEMSENDKIIFTKNDSLEVLDDVLHPDRKSERIKVQNGQSAKVLKSIGSKLYVSVQNQIVVIENDLLKKGSFQHFDYNYAVTEHKSQGATVDHLISYAPTKNMNSFNSFYVGVTRAKHDLTLLTDDPKVLAAQVKKEQSKITTNDFEIDIKTVDTKTDSEHGHSLKKLKKELELGSKTKISANENFTLVPKELLDAQLKFNFVNDKTTSKIILADNQDHSDKLNSDIRETLKIKGKLQNPIVINTFREKDLTAAVEKDSILISQKYDHLLGLKKGEKLSFKSLNENGYNFENQSTKKLVSIKDEDLNKFKHYKIIPREIAKGDKVVFKENDRKNKLTADLDGIVLKASKTKIEVLTKKGVKEVNTDIRSEDSNLAFDYAYSKEKINSQYDKVHFALTDDSSLSLDKTKQALKYSKLEIDGLFSDEKNLDDILSRDSELLDSEFEEQQNLDLNLIEEDRAIYEEGYTTDYSSESIDNIHVMLTNYNNEKTQEHDLNLNL
jgi:conjugative relaxase-like TrwC/TraI family protein